MYYYFSSEIPISIKLNGLYFGQLFKTAKRINIEGDTFIEVIPMQNTYTPKSIMLTQNVLDFPPKEIAVTNLEGGYLIHFLTLEINSAFREIASKTLNKALVSVFIDKHVYLSVRTNNSTYLEQLLYIPQNVEISELQNCITVIVHSNVTTVYAFSISDRITKIFERTVSEYTLNTNLITTTVCNDIAKHKIVEEWNFNGLHPKLTERKITTSDKFNIDDLKDNILPYAFLEELCMGGLVSPYLTGNVLENEDKLKEYFGEFLGIFPPPVFRDVDEIGVIHKESDNKYFAKYYTFDVQNKKIYNIKRRQ